MTKSGIGTAGVGQKTITSGGTVNSAGSTTSNQVTNIAQAEIPIWVSRQKEMGDGHIEKNNHSGSNPGDPQAMSNSSSFVQGSIV